MIPCNRLPLCKRHPQGMRVLIVGGNGFVGESCVSYAAVPWLIMYRIGHRQAGPCETMAGRKHKVGRTQAEKY